MLPLCWLQHAALVRSRAAPKSRYPTDMMIKLMDRGFAPVAIALSFVAGNRDRSGDEVSFRGLYVHDMRASTAAPPLRSCADEPPPVGPRHGDPAPSQVAEVPIAGLDSQSLPCRRPSSVSDFRRAAARSAAMCEYFCNFASILSHGCELEVNTSIIGW
jgi:hypothetical protein